MIGLCKHEEQLGTIKIGRFLLSNCQLFKMTLCYVFMNFKLMKNLYLLEPCKLKNMMQIPNLDHKRSDIAWKPDCTLLAVGNVDGSVVLTIASSWVIRC
jgi:hypothetical protein